ncbi:MAG: NUDIX hydrolase, partial [Ktedonobacterales bacterium]
MRHESGPFEEKSSATIRRARLLRDAGALLVYLRQTLPQQADPLPASGPAAGAKVAAVLAPIYARGGHPYLLFTQRSLALSRHRGEISFPGGSRDASDGTLRHTALREASEEIGLAPSRIELLGALPSVFTSVSNYLIVPYAGWLGEGMPELRVNAAEVAEVIEAPLAALADSAI